jgi:hypothetical protein
MATFPSDSGQESKYFNGLIVLASRKHGLVAQWCFYYLHMQEPVLLQRFSVGRGPFREDEMTSQAATWNSPAMNSAWALMSLPPMLRTCPFLIIAIAS